MNMKRKIILMGVCIGIILIVLTVNIVRKLTDEQGTDQYVIQENVITRAEAYRLLSYLEYNKADREALVTTITYMEKDMSGWYDAYVNAVCKMGLIEDKVTVDPKVALSYGDCKEIIDKLIMIHPEYQSAYQTLTFEFTEAKKDMLIEDYLELYQALLDTIPQESRPVCEETLYVLGQEETEVSTGRMITDQGKYYYDNAINYEAYIKNEDNLNQSKAEETTDEEKVTAENNSSNSMIQEDMEDLASRYMDKVIHVLTCDEEILYITNTTTEKTIIHNVWIEKASDLQVDTFINDMDKSFPTVSKLKTPIEKAIGDITIENGKIIKINVKPDMIQGKVIRIGEDFIEIAGYGEVPLDENFRIYKIYGEYSMEATNSILVGYENTDFVVSDGKISAALITESIKAENIRVLIKTSNFKSVYHDSIEFTATSDFTVSTKKKDYTYNKNETVTLKPGDKLLEDGRITIKTDSENGKIEILSIKRTCGNPEYRGSMEISEEAQGLIMVNELPLEEYLYAVVPSEMPTSYGMEALKVQAVCARSYAYRHLLANSLSEYGAHVDDSSIYQVYNNIAENEDSILAVKDTYGKVLEYQGEVIAAYYYSTSCGHTSEPTSIGSDDTDLPYLNGKLILEEKEGEAVQTLSQAEKQYEDLSSEENFKSFLEATNITTYDSSYTWYRWKVTMDIKDIKKVIDSNLAQRYKANPKLILTMTRKATDGEEAVFESIPVDTVGNIVDISVLKRDTSGKITELLITGSENTIKVQKDYNIRMLLAPTYDSVIRQDESEIKNLSILPSAFFYIERKENNGKLKSMILTGGGYGHGVGLSQNAVKTMAEEGKEYEEILAYFYEGTQTEIIYE